MSTESRELPAKWLKRIPVGDCEDEYSGGYDDALRHCASELRESDAAQIERENIEGWKQAGHWRRMYEAIFTKAAEQPAGAAVEAVDAAAIERFKALHDEGMKAYNAVENAAGRTPRLQASIDAGIGHALAAMSMKQVAGGGGVDASPTMEDAVAAGDGTLHGAIDYWQGRALAAEAANPATPVADEAMALHWIDRYATGIDDEPNLEAISEALGAALSTRDDGASVDYIESPPCPAWINDASRAWAGAWRESYKAHRSAAQAAPQQDDTP